jgi:hypothetical protein
VRNHGTPKNLERHVWFKIVASSFQVNAITTAAFQWSDAIDDYFGLQGDVSSLGVSYFNLACFSSSSSSALFSETLLFLLSPVILIALTVCIAKLHKKDLQVALSVGVVVLYLLHPALTTRTAVVLACIKMGSAQDDWFLLEDLSIRCWSSEHNALLWGLAFPMFVIYVVGVPLVAAWLLWTNRQLVREKLGDDGTKFAFVLEGLRTASRDVGAASEPVDRATIYQTEQIAVNDKDHVQCVQENVVYDPSNEVKSPPVPSLSSNGTRTRTMQNADIFETNYGFLFLGFHARAYYWEIVIMVRKALLSGFAVAFESDLRVQV